MHGGHYLKTTKSDTMPSQVCVVAWVESRQKRNGHDNVYEPGFVTGSLVRWRQREGRQLCRFQFPIHQPAQVLERLRRQALGGSLTWCFTFNLKGFLACSGFWDRVLAGEIDLWGEDRGMPRQEPRNGRSKWKGYVVLENPPAIVVCRWRPYGGAIKFVDLANYNLTGWKQLAEIDQENLLPDGDQPHFTGTLQDLAKRWAQAAESWLVELWRTMGEEKLGAWQTTAAGQAQYTFRRKFLTHDVLVHENQEAKALERAALYGGRCELRFQGNVRRDTAGLWTENAVVYGHRQAITRGPIYHLDVVSMYPAVAQFAPIPARLNQWFPEIYHASMINKGVFQGMIADVTVNVRQPVVPFTQDEITVWPVGRFRTCLCGPELVLVQQYGAVEAIHQAATYHMELLFHDYVKWFWEFRQGLSLPMDGALDSWAKMMMNSVFGKFSQRSKRWVTQPGKIADEPFDQWFEPTPNKKRPDSYRSIAWEVEKLTVIGEHKQSCPAITAWVNSLARVRLWEMI